MSMHWLTGKVLARWAGLALVVAAIPFGANQVYDVAAASKTSVKAPTSSPSNCGNCNGNNGSGAGNGGSTGSGSPGKALTASVDNVTKIAPGVDGVVTVRVNNPNNQDVLVTRVAGVVTGVTSGTRQGLPSCDKAWILLDEYPGTKLIRQNGFGTVTMPVRFDNKPGINQDNCKDVTYTFSFTVYGQQA